MRALTCAGVLGAALLAGCTATIPEGQLQCASDTECPPEWSCTRGLCFSARPDAGSAFDAGMDAGSDAGRDGGRDAGRRDAGRDAGTDASDDAEAPLDAGPAVPIGVAAGGDHSCVLYSDGRVFCWGDNQEAQLGSGAPSVDPVTRARPIASAPPGWAQIAAGVYHTCARSTDGVWCWGRNAEGQLGNGTDTTVESAPSPVVLPADDPVVDLSAGGNVTCVAHASGVVRCWGQDYFGVLGRSSTLTAQRMPVVVSGAEGAVEVDVSGTHACARRAGGEVLCWGNNGSGQLGRGTMSILEHVPAPVTGVVATELALGLEHSCASTSAGLFCWGENDWGQLGDATRDDALSPIAIGPPPGVPLVSITASGENRGWRGGGSHTCAIGAERAGDAGPGSIRLYCWGATGSGRLGIGPTPLMARQLTPDLVLDLASASTIDAGHEHTCAITGDEVWCWGNNARGQLGNLTTTSSTRPVGVADLP